MASKWSMPNWKTIGFCCFLDRRVSKPVWLVEIGLVSFTFKCMQFFDSVGEQLDAVFLRANNAPPTSVWLDLLYHCLLRVSVLERKAIFPQEAPLCSQQTLHNQRDIQSAWYCKPGSISNIQHTLHLGCFITYIYLFYVLLDLLPINCLPW